MDVDNYAQMQQALLGARQQATIEAKAEGYDDRLTNLHIENSVMRQKQKKEKEDGYRAEVMNNVKEYNSVLSSLQKRTGMSDTELANVKQFAKRVLTAESSGNWEATNNTSSAAGGYQFIKGSVVPAINRMEKMLQRDGKKLPQWAVNLKNSYNEKTSDSVHRKMMTKLNPAQQTALFLADISEKTVANTSGLGDKLLKGIGSGDTKAEALLYLLGHHTSHQDKGVMNNVRQTWEKLTDKDQLDIEDFIKNLNS
jgi:hypothetical protein